MNDFEVNKKVWFVHDLGISEHVIEETRIINKQLQIKIDNKWFSTDDFYSSLNKAMEVEEGRTFLSFK